MHVLPNVLSSRARSALAGFFISWIGAALYAQSTPIQLTVTGLAADNKVYDASAAASLTGSAALSGAVTPGDDVSLTGAASGAFADASAGDGKDVTVSGLALSGANAANYALSVPTLKANIAKKSLSLTASASDKVYDGTTAASVTLGALTGAAGSDLLGLSSATYNFASKSVGSGKSILVSGLSLTGAAAGNYTLQVPVITAAITAKSITIVGITAASKVYDGQTSATPNFAGATATGLISGDVVSVSGTASFDTKNVGAGKSVTIAGLALSGADAGNYSLSSMNAAATADITAKNLTVSGLTATKVYDATTAAPLNFGAAQLNGVIAGDAVALATSSGSAAFADKAAGSGKTVVVSGLSLTGTDAANYTLTSPTASGDITKKNLTVSGLVATDKIYDRTTAATLTGSPTLNGVASGTDDVSLTTSIGANFSDKNIGTAKPVTITGLALAGADASNYTLTLPGATASISKKELSVSGLSATSKEYDGTSNAVFTASVSGVIDGDTVSLAAGGSAAFDDKNVGAGKSVTVSGLGISGADAANYNLGVTSASTSASISAKNLTITGIAANKVYDGSATAVLNLGGAALNGRIGADDVALVSAGASGAFADKAVGAGKSVTTSGFTLGGLDATNYTLSQPTLTAEITKRELSVSGITAAGKVYDGSTAAVVDASGAILNGVLGGDGVSLATAGAAGTFATKAAGSSKVVVISGLTLGGADAANYSLPSPTTTADITRKTITVSGLTVAKKTYDQTATATLAGGTAVLVGVVDGDAVSLSLSGATASFASVAVGSGIPVMASGLGLTGASAGNYTVITPDLVGDITRGSASINFTDLNQTYDGKAKSVQTATTPPGLGVDLNYVSGKPTNAGTYLVIATINDANYEGSATRTLTIAKAEQTITFPSPGAPTIGKPLALSATTSSGLAATFSVVSGNATISGTSVTVNDSSTVVVQAAQGGDTNYNAAPKVSVTLSAPKLSQTISFAALPTHTAGDAPFALSATASSKLPVAFSLVSGPASLAGNTITLSGAPGIVSVRASQAGDSIYSAAGDVTQTFAVTASGPVIYFGALSSGGTGFALAESEGPSPVVTAAAATDSFAAQVASDSLSGTMLGYISARKEAFVVAFQPDAVGNFVTTATTVVPGTAGVAHVFRGRISGGVLSGSIDGLGITFSATVQPGAGATSSLAGYYSASALGTTIAATHAIVSAAGQAFVLAILPASVEGQTTAMSADGKFSLTTAAKTVISGAIDVASSGVNTTLTASGQPAITCSGLKSSVARTDRLVNLSSRALVGSGSRMLISGFVISGSNPKTVLVRAVGPGLSGFGVSGVVTNPQLTIFSGGTVVAQNRGWSTAANATEISATAARVGAFALTAGSTDSVVLTTLLPGAYTAQISNAGTDAVALAEIYDASAGADGQRLANVSTRGVTGSGESVLIGGFVVSGNSPKQVLIRGVGPALGGFGVDATVADPVVSVYQNTTVLGQNDNWDADAAAAKQLADAAAKTGAFTLAPGSKDAAILLTLAPGSYTAQVAGKAGTSGVALVEIYEVQ